AAGPAANLLVAFLLFFIVYLTGAPTGDPTTKVRSVQTGSPAAAAGLRPDDRVVAVNGHAASTFDGVSKRIRASHRAPITVTVVRSGERIPLGPRPTTKSGDRWIWGFTPGIEEVSYGPATSARYAA